MNKKINTIIIDDDLAAIEKLSNDLRSFPEIKVLDSATSAETAKKIIIEKQPDLLFLDIEMPGASGIELLKEIQSEIAPDMHIIFYTAYDQYLRNSLLVADFDYYLLKPYLPEELATAIERVRSKNNQATVENLLKQENLFAIQTVTGIKMLKQEDILLFEYPPNKRNWRIRFCNNRYQSLRVGITSKDILPISPYFVQINQNCIINITYLASIENKTLQCKFHVYPDFDYTDIIQEISPLYYKKIKNRLDIL